MSWVTIVETSPILSIPLLNLLNEANYRPMKELSPLFRRTITLVKNIPEGSVTSYGRIADLIAAPGCGRHVSYILSSSSKKYGLPWHRVISSSGKLPSHASARRQRRLLEQEDIEIDGTSIDMDQYLWKPTKTEVNKLLKGIPKHKSIYLRKN